MVKQVKEFEFCYCDIETLRPGSDDPQFWFGGIKVNGVYRWTDNVETYLHWLFFDKRNARKKILLFFNAEYDMSFMQYYLKGHGYKENPKKNTGDKCFYTGQKWEIYTDHHQYRQPISVVDIQALLTKSVGEWGKVLDFEKGETPIIDEYRPPTDKDLAYLKRDIDIIEQASYKTKMEDAIKDGCLTISSIVNHDIKNGMRKLRGTPTRRSGFRARHTAPEQKENTVPYAILKRADKAVEGYMEEYTCKQGNKVLFKPCQDEVKEYRSRVVRAHLKQLEYDYTKEVVKSLREYNRAKYMKLDVKKELYVDGSDINKKYLERIIITTVNESIRPGLRGGISWVNPVYKNKILPPGFTLDVNSMYPSVILDTELPYEFVGMSTDGEEPDLNKYFIAEITELKAKVKPEHHPWLKRSTAYTRDKYYEPSIHWKGHINKNKQAWDTVLTSADINYMYECYDVEKIEYRRIFYFNPNKDFTKVVRDYIEYWRKIKETSTGAYRELAKLHLNALWGRWSMTSKIVEDGGKKIDVGERTSNLVSAIFVTAYARIRLNRMMNRFYEYVVYTDTDSVHVLFPPNKTQEDVEESISDLIHPTRFGKWKIEQTWERARYIKPKTYCHEDKDGSLDFTAAGVPNRYIKHSFKKLEEFKTGITFQVLKKVKLEDGRISLQAFPSTI